jgi:hypothetical protein
VFSLLPADGFSPSPSAGSPYPVLSSGMGHGEKHAISRPEGTRGCVDDEASRNTNTGTMMSPSPRLSTLTYASHDPECIHTTRMDVGEYGYGESPVCSLVMSPPCTVVPSPPRHVGPWISGLPSDFRGVTNAALTLPQVSVAKASQAMQSI